MKILLIDDEPRHLDILSLVLEMYGCKCRKITDSLQAAQLLKKEWFDVVMTDIKMPHCNGIELIRIILSHNSAGKIIAISGEADEKVRKEALKAGADVFVAKPVDVESLIEIINLNGEG